VRVLKGRKADVYYQHRSKQGLRPIRFFR
jgi:hypothetical protein